MPSTDSMETSQEAGQASASSSSSSPRTVVMPPPPRAAELLFVNDDQRKKLYWDRSHYASPEDQMKALAKSSSLYIGNLAFSTRSRQIRAHFSQLGLVQSIHMGLDRLKKSPCGFCFVEYIERKDALAAVACLSGTKLDGKVIRVELDAGFQAGRQYGRGISGGQVRDDRRNSSDPARKRARPSEPGPFPMRPEGGGDDTNTNPGVDNNNNGGGGGEGDDEHYGPTGDSSLEHDAKRQRR
jgi:nuclear cap-binding protein subunit 2